MGRSELTRVFLIYCICERTYGDLVKRVHVTMDMFVYVNSQPAISY